MTTRGWWGERSWNGAGRVEALVEVGEYPCLPCRCALPSGPRLLSWVMSVTERARSRAVRSGGAASKPANHQPPRQQQRQRQQRNKHLNRRQRNQGTRANVQVSRPGRERWCSVISPTVPCPVLLRRKRREPVGRPDTTRLTSPPAVAARAPATPRASLAQRENLLMPRAKLATMRGGGFWCSRPRRRSQSLATAHLTRLTHRNL